MSEEEKEGRINTPRSAVVRGRDAPAAAAAVFVLLPLLLLLLVLPSDGTEAFLPDFGQNRLWLLALFFIISKSLWQNKKNLLTPRSPSFSW